MDWLPFVLKFVLLSGISLLIALATLLAVRRPHVHRHHPRRRRMPRWTAAAAILVALAGGLVGLVGASEVQTDLQNGRNMLIAGTLMALLGLFLLWAYTIVYVEAEPEAFRHRGLLGAESTIAYRDILSIDTAQHRGATTITLRGRDGTKIAAGPMFFDWEPMRELQARDAATREDWSR